MTRIALGLVSLIALIASPAEARTKHHKHYQHHRHHIHKYTAPPARAYRTRQVYDANANVAVIGGRPAGCPYQFCGCGLRKYLGITDKRLDLAWNWAKFFPRATPRPGVAAVHHHHVMLLVSHVSGSNWIVRDYNGGRHLSYIHERNVAGYVFVDPS